MHGPTSYVPNTMEIGMLKGRNLAITMGFCDFSIWVIQVNSAALVLKIR